jgi:antitoxin ParD1/3/4
VRLASRWVRIDRAREGRYSNTSEIVREAWRLLEEQEQERQAKLKALRQAAKQGFEEIDQGKGIVLKGRNVVNLRQALVGGTQRRLAM